MANFMSGFGEIRGSVGMFTFSRTKNGPIMKLRTKPVQPMTTAQTLQQNKLAGLATDWGAVLTQSQRDNWKFFANQHPMPNKIGQMYKLSGIAMYMKVNGVLATAEQTTLADPPTNLQVRAIGQSSIVGATPGEASCVVEMTTPIATPTEMCYCFVAANVAPGVSNANNQLVFAGAIEGDNLATEFEFDLPSKFGALIAGNKIFVQIFRLNTVNGALTPGIILDIVIT